MNSPSDRKSRPSIERNQFPRILIIVGVVVALLSAGWLVQLGIVQQMAHSQLSRSDRPMEEHELYEYQAQVEKEGRFLNISEVRKEIQAQAIIIAKKNIQRRKREAAKLSPWLWTGLAVGLALVLGGIIWRKIGVAESEKETFIDRQFVARSPTLLGKSSPEHEKTVKWVVELQRFVFLIYAVSISASLVGLALVASFELEVITDFFAILSTILLVARIGCLVGLAMKSSSNGLALVRGLVLLYLAANLSTLGYYSQDPSAGEVSPMVKFGIGMLFLGGVLVELAILRQSTEFLNRNHLGPFGEACWKSGSRRDFLCIATYQRIMMAAFATYMLLTAVLLPIAFYAEEHSAYLFVALAVLILHQVSGLTFTVFAILLAMKGFRADLGVLLSFVTMLPIAAVFSLQIVNVRINKILTQNGFEVGMMGANIKHWKTMNPESGDSSMETGEI